MPVVVMAISVENMDSLVGVLVGREISTLPEAAIATVLCHIRSRVCMLDRVLDLY
jgi:hypothetical protein